ncbi:MAG: hypothetical protein PHW73_10385 [Atribacterota bacterium]|nr:hypothetical protein [Atribacterota bacterium]
MDQIFKKAHKQLDAGYFGQEGMTTEEAIEKTHALLNNIELQVRCGILEDLEKIKTNIAIYLVKVAEARDDEYIVVVNDDLIDDIMMFFKGAIE